MRLDVTSFRFQVRNACFLPAINGRGFHRRRFCEDGSIPRFESDTPQLRVVTEAEWFEIADAREKSIS